ncbi:MAG: hypothetical protein DI551_10355, partial [Micavibrio aeruginosavorus]
VLSFHRIDIYQKANGVLALEKTFSGHIQSETDMDSYQAIHATVQWLGERAYLSEASEEAKHKLKAFVVDLQTALDAQPRTIPQAAPVAPAA